MDVLLREVEESDLDVLFEQEVDPEANRMAAFTWRTLPTARRSMRAGAGCATARAASSGRSSRTARSWAASFAGATPGFPAPRSHTGSAASTGARGSQPTALELFLELARERPIFGRCAADNVGSLRVLEKNGFVLEAEERGFANARGTEIDEVLLRLA